MISSKVRAVIDLFMLRFTASTNTIFGRGNLVMRVSDMELLLRSGWLRNLHAVILQVTYIILRMPLHQNGFYGKMLHPCFPALNKTNLLLSATRYNFNNVNLIL
ncbi:hypothetical protein KSP39_PZI013389 [Platanthera zijinensis]|uniref:Uncharacterized protein n=1 Tax=Platanthera zijinensis TaxID=2320716 RepID=A0AAP0G460_9ASPA